MLNKFYLKVASIKKSLISWKDRYKNRAHHYGVDVTLVSSEGLNTVGSSDIPQLKILRSEYCGIPL